MPMHIVFYIHVSLVHPVYIHTIHTHTHTHDPADGESRTLAFGEFKSGLEKAGIRMGERDFESVWRRADVECRK